MERIPEPELMEDEEQARAYAAADFEDAHSGFIRLFRDFARGREIRGYVLDLGCGPGDIAMRFARAYRDCIVHGIDGSEAMLRCGRRIISEAVDLGERVELIHGRLPGISPPRQEYDVVLSNSLLHHLEDPMVLWAAVRVRGAPGAPVFVMDLERPPDRAEARRLVEVYAGREPDVLRRDFQSSLLAAFETGEVRKQLRDAGMGEYLSVRSVSDRHLVVQGVLPPRRLRRKPAAPFAAGPREGPGR